MKNQRDMTGFYRYLLKETTGESQPGDSQPGEGGDKRETGGDKQETGGDTDTQIKVKQEAMGDTDAQVKVKEEKEESSFR